MRIVLSLAFFLSCAVAQAQEPPSETSLDKCKAFCRQVFSAGSDDLETCRVGCRDADACNATCGERYPEDKVKQTVCMKRCMRR